MHSLHIMHLEEDEPLENVASLSLNEAAGVRRCMDPN